MEEKIDYIYVVASGLPSDGAVNGAFTDLEAAETFASKVEAKHPAWGTELSRFVANQPEVREVGLPFTHLYNNRKY